MKILMIALTMLSFAQSVLAGDCYESSIEKPSPFMGNDGEIIKLDDGSLWEIKYEYEYMYEYNPDVIICPNSNTLHVNGKKLNVEKMN